MNELILVAAAVVVQITAAGLAFQLNRKIGWQWSWTLVSLGMSVMAIRRGVTLYRLVVMEASVREASAISETAAGATLISSLLLCIGVWLIGPLLKTVSKQQRQLQSANSDLSMSLELAEADLSAARFIQERLFPDAETQYRSLRVAGRCQPMRFAGGDYFDYFTLSDGRLAVVIADVSGHGVGPAILMAELRACLRTAGRRTSDPAELITEANRLLCEAESTGRFVTMFLAVLDESGNSFSYVAGGHEAWLVAADGTVNSLQCDNLPLGIDPAEIYTTRHLSLDPNTLLFLATDGIAETANQDGEMFGIARMMQQVVNDRVRPPLQLVDRLLASVGDFRGKATMTDDITAVAVSFSGAAI